MAQSYRIRQLVRRTTIGVVILGLWQFASLFFPTFLLPGIPEVIEATWSAISDPQFGTYHRHILITFARLLAGFLIAVGVGGLLGSAMGLRRDAEAFLRGWVVLGLSVPSIAVAFALVIIVGISNWVPILTVVIVGVPFVMLNMWEGTQSLDHEIDEMAAFFGAGRWQKIRDVLLPQLLQFLFPAMYWGFIVAWKVLFIAEVFGAGSGVGYMVSYWFVQQRVDMLLGWVLVPIIVVILAQEGLRFAEHRVMAWR